MNTTYRKRREKLLKDKKAPYFAVFYGVNNPDLPLPFDRNFYYFTGLKNVTQVLVIKKDENGIHDKLYIETYNDRFVKFNGGFFSIEDAKKATGIEDVVFNENFEEEFVEELRKYENVTVGLDISENENIVAPNEELLEILMENNIPVESLWDDIYRLRLVKDEMEIENFSKATNLSNNKFIGNYIVYYYNSSAYKGKVGSYNYDILTFGIISVINDIDYSSPKGIKSFGLFMLKREQAEKFFEELNSYGNNYKSSRILRKFQWVLFWKHWTKCNSDFCFIKKQQWQVFDYSK